MVHAEVSSGNGIVWLSLSQRQFLAYLFLIVVMERVSSYSVECLSPKLLSIAALYIRKGICNES